MKKTSVFLNFFFALTIFFQSQAQASGILLPYSPEVIQEIVSNYNKLSQHARKQQFLALLKQSPAADQQFFQQHESEMEKLHWPDLLYKDGKFHLSSHGTQLGFHLEGSVMTVKGENISLTPGNLKTAVEKLEKLLEKKSFSLMNLFISSAYALGFVAILLALAAIAVVAFVLAPAFTMVKTTIAKLQCHKIRSELEDYQSSSFSQSQADELLRNVNRILDQTNEGLRAENCSARPSRNPAHCAELNHTKRCYEFVQREVEQRFANQVNSSDRGWGIKEFFFGTIPKGNGIPAARRE